MTLFRQRTSSVLTVVFLKMRTVSNNIVICYADKRWTDTQIAREFPNEKWNYRSIWIIWFGTVCGNLCTRNDENRL